MALQIRRGPTAHRTNKTFVEGELVYDTEEKALYIGDGTTAGGKSASTYTDGQATNAAGALLNSATGNVDFTYDSETSALTANVTLDGTYNDVVQDTSPQLGGELSLNGNNITGTGNINITGSVTATSFSGPLTGDVSGDVTGDLTGNVTGDVSGNAGTVTNGIYTSHNFYIGTEQISITRASNAQTLAGVSIGGNAATATKLAATANINGVAFDGSADITVADSTKLPTAGGTISGNLTVSGDLTVNGTTTTLNTSTLDVEDINITIAKGATTALAANGAGISIDGANASLIYANTGDKFVFDKRVESTVGFLGPITGDVLGDVTGDVTGDVYASNGTSKVLESGTDGTNATFTGNVTGDVTGNVNGDVTGDVTGNVSGNVTGNLTGSVYTVGTDLIIDSIGNVFSPQVTTPDVYSGVTGSTTFHNEVTFNTSVNFSDIPVFLRGGSVVVSSNNFATADVYSALLPNKSTFNNPVQFAQYTQTDRDLLRTIVDVTGASGDSTTATLTFTRQPSKIAEVGSQIVVTGMSPNGYNGTFTVTASTDSTISYLNATTGFVSGGSIACPLLNGTVIYNTTADKFQGRAGGAWVDLS